MWSIRKHGNEGIDHVLYAFYVPVLYRQIIPQDNGKAGKGRGGEENGFDYTTRNVLFLLKETLTGQSPTPTSREHEQVLEAPLTHGGGCLAGHSLVIVIQNYDLPMSIFLVCGDVKAHTVT